MSFPSSPRPILKKHDLSRSPTWFLQTPNSLDGDLFALRKNVQFSPENKTFLTHPSDEYDRSPIKVSYNTCEIPDRDSRGSPSRRRGRRSSNKRPEGLLQASPTGTPSTYEMVMASPVFEEDNDEAELTSRRFERPNTPIPSFGRHLLDDDDDDELADLGQAHAPTLPPLVRDSSESDESDVTSPSLEPPQFSWTTESNALKTALTLGGPRYGSPSRKTSEVLARSVKYPAQLSLSSTSQPAVFQKRSRLNAQRHRIPLEFTQTPSHERDVFDDTAGVICESWVVSAPNDDATCLDGF
ncbi:hypothetical protein QCA50_007063 [Cerrena zonata]|uniref:Uncharacterized protein n=1 Tax=Cerrena zonata TaxID=2478898 RepID=A0AAW0GAL9_9APHY